MDLKLAVINSLKTIKDWKNKRLLIGYSGGLDSTVLLYLIKQIQQDYPRLNYRAVYVNHGLQEAAEQWQQHCQSFCENFKIPYQSLTTTKIKSSGKGLEDAAREARFKSLSKIVLAEDVLLLAHHANDQSETRLFRLIRGAGIHGLSGIKRLHTIGDMKIVRPLLSIEKTTLEKFALERKLNWIEDNSNNDNRFDRNYIRNELLPVIHKRWPDFHQRINNSTELLEQQGQLLDELATIDAKKLFLDGEYFILDKIDELSQHRVMNVLSWWFKNVLGYSLSSNRMIAIYKEIKNLRVDAKFKQQCGNFVLIQSGSRLYLIANDFFEQVLEPIQINSLFPNSFSSDISLQINKHCLLKFNFKSKSDFRKFIKLDCTLKFGVKNSNYRLGKRKHSCSTRKLFQKSDFPSWLKSYWPILMDENTLCSLPCFGHQHLYQTVLDGVTIDCVFSLSDCRHLEVDNKLF